MNRMKKCIGVVSVCGVIVFVSACSDVGPTTDPYADMDAGVDMSTPVDMPKTQTPVDLGKDTGPVDQGVQLPAPKEVQAIASAEGITLSWLPAFNAVRYEVRINGGPWLNAGLEMTYSHDDAPGGKVVSATTVASDMTERQHVQLSIEDLVTEDGPEQTYEVRAIYYNGASEASAPIIARRPFSLESVQWQRQLNDGDSWEDLTEAITITSMDTSASPEGNTHSYQAILTPSYGQSFHSPVDLGARLAAVKVAAGMVHVCALLNNGDVKCWGSNTEGQLGLGHSESLISDLDSSYPLGRVKLPEPMIQVSVGVASSCALSVSGKLYCWGRLHSGTEPFKWSGDEIAPLDSSSDIKVLPDAYDKSLCYVTLSDDVKCFGFNGILGLLGSGDMESTISPPSEPVDLGGAKIRDVQMSYTGPCALTDTNQLMCWGKHSYVNNGETIGDEPGEMPPPVTGSSEDVSVRQMALGTFDNGCLLDESTGRVRCWGVSEYGQTGLGHTNAVTAPGEYTVLSRTGSAFEVAEQIAFAATTACMITQVGDVYCWGKGGAEGLNGTGSAEHIGDDPEDVMARVNLGGPASSISMRHGVACVIVIGDVKCWGNNAVEQLGVSSLGKGTIIGDEPGEMPPQPVELW